jgi:hypothetical protein
LVFELLRSGGVPAEYHDNNPFKNIEQRLRAHTREKIVIVLPFPVLYRERPLSKQFPTWCETGA